MKIATWNINSIRARLDRLIDYLQTRAPDVLCLQELKCTDEQFPLTEIEAAGYRAEVFGQKTYNGVATTDSEKMSLQRLPKAANSLRTCGWKSERADTTPATRPTSVRPNRETASRSVWISCAPA